MMGTRSEEILRRERMEMTLPTLIDLFAATKEIEGKSPKTIKWYVNLLGHFASYLGKTATLRHLTLNNARSFVAHLRGKERRYVGHPLSPEKKGGLSPHTIHAYVRSLKAFSSWLQEEGFTNQNVLGRLKRPKLPETVIEILSDEEIDRILTAINPGCFLGPRLWVMVLLLLDTGIRAGELTGLTTENTHVDDGYVKVEGKGRKERIVPFGSTTKKALLRYLATWRVEPAFPDVHELILSVNGTAMSYYGTAQCIKRLGKRAGVPRLHCHLFRHTFAVRYLMNGGDVMTLKLILGHSTLEVTQMYLHFAEAHVRLQHHKFSPVDRLGIRTRRRRNRR